MKEDKEFSKKLLRHCEDPTGTTKQSFSKDEIASPLARNNRNRNCSKPIGESCPITTDIIWLKEEQECPNCHFAKLKLDENKDLKCPVCGFGTAKPYT